MSANNGLEWKCGYDDRNVCKEEKVGEAMDNGGRDDGFGDRSGSRGNFSRTKAVI